MREDSLLPDTHAHLDSPLFDDDRDEVIRRATHAGVDRILAVGTDLATSRCAVSLARKYATVFAAVGVDPHHAGTFARDSAEVKALLKEEKVVAVGEIGLDYERCSVSLDVQQEAFNVQLDWARELRVPVSVHNRGANADVSAALSTSGVQAVLHCFSGDAAAAREAIERGCYVSFAGNVTFKNAHALREVAREIPRERVLVESDAPVLAPQAWRGRRNEPAYVLAIADTLSGLYGEHSTITAGRLSAAADRVYGWRTV